MRLNRRSFLAASGSLMTLGACNSSGLIGAPEKRQIDEIGIQTYTLRDAMAEDFVGTFQMIKDVGYDYVELNGRNFVDRSPQDLRTLLDDIGLPAPITHLDYDSLANRPDEVAEVCNTLGCRYAILPWVGDDQRGLENHKAHAAMLNRAGEAMKSADVMVGYHNHQFEFFDLGDGETGMNILLTETDPDLVTFELDLFWAALTGTDIPALFNAHPGRFRMCHVKDLSGDAGPWRNSLDFPAIVQTLMANVGEGDLPFETYFAENDVSGMQFFIAEHDNPPQPYRESVQTSYDAMRAMRF